MKARVFEFEGPPDEVAEVIRALQAAGIDPKGAASSSGASSIDGTATGVALPAEITNWLDTKNPPFDRRPWIEHFLAELLTGGEVRMKVGASSKNADGLANRASLYKIGTKGAAFGYLDYRGKLWLRLPTNTSLEGSSKAQARNVNPPHDHYGILVMLEDQDGVTDAIKLSRLALDRL
jgi:hypothetical protein